jgi:hypothetical protein
LLDNHTIVDAAFALFDFGTPEYLDTFRRLRAAAFASASHLPKGSILILTSAFADTDFGRENWQTIRDLANARGSALAHVVLDCDFDENARRLVAQDRHGTNKLTDPALLARSRERGRALLDGGGDLSLRLDVTRQSAIDVATRIANWLAVNEAVARA